MPHPSSLLTALSRHRALFGAVTLAAMLIAVAVTLLQPRFESTSRVFVATSSAIGLAAGLLLGLGAVALRERVAPAASAA